MFFLPFSHFIIIHTCTGTVLKQCVLVCLRVCMHGFHRLAAVDENVWQKAACLDYFRYVSTTEDIGQNMSTYVDRLNIQHAQAAESQTDDW